MIVTVILSVTMTVTGTVAVIVTVILCVTMTVTGTVAVIVTVTLSMTVISSVSVKLTVTMIVTVSVSVNMTNQILSVEGVPEEAAHRSEAKAKLQIVNRLKSQHCVVGLCVAVFVDVGIVT